MAEQKDFYTTQEVAEGLGISVSRANQLMHKHIRNNPSTQRIKKTQSAGGRFKYLMHESLYNEEVNQRLAEAKWSAGEEPENNLLAEGLHHQIEADGSTSYVMVYSQADYAQIEAALGEYNRLKAANEDVHNELNELRVAHERHTEQLQQLYEENIETYREQTAYLRNRIEKADITLQELFRAHNNAIAADQQRNYLAAGIKPKE